MRDNDLLRALAVGFGAAAADLLAEPAPLGLRQFLEQEVQTDFGLWRIEGHEPMLEVIELLDRIVTHCESNSKVSIVKAEQIGFTTFALGFAVWLAAERRYNTAYFFPTDKMASEWGIAKLNPFISESERLSKLVDEGSVDRGVLKEFAGKYLYLVGLNKIPTSRPNDFQVSDEVDLTSEMMRRWKRGRMRHSSLRCELDFSAPYAQDSGIDARFNEGSQRRMLYKCLACGADDICLEEAFPECMREFNGKWVRVCPSCHRKLNLVETGRWVATYPLREERSHGDGPHYSYRISALSMEAIDANEIMASYNHAVDTGNPDEMAIFNRSVRAFADAGSMQPFDEVTIGRLSTPGDWGLAIGRQSHPVYFGVDCGNACWIWFEELLPDGRTRLVYAEKMHSDKWVERTIELVRRFDARFGVVDKYPYTTDSRKLAYALGNSKVALLDFDNSKEQPVMVTERLIVEGTVGEARKESGPVYNCVKVDRNTALAAFCAQATNVDRGLLLSREQSKIMDLVRNHLKKLQKVMAPQASGDKRHQFIDGVENHLGMSGLGAYLARHFAPPTVGFNIFTVGEREALSTWGGADETPWGGIRGGR